MGTNDEHGGGPCTRRRALGMLGGAAALLATARARAAAAAAADDNASKMCVVRPRQTEGPFFVDTDLNRSDIRFDPSSRVSSPGAPVRVVFRVFQTTGNGCEPLPNARVDLWHCDAEGLYSDAESWQEPTRGAKFLRGYQVTNQRGIVLFTTIYPGWYPNRTVHMHFKIRTGAAGGKGFTSQLYFDDDLTDVIHAQPPYAARGPRQVRNNRDLIHRIRGSRLMLPLREERKGYVGVFDIALEM